MANSQSPLVDSCIETALSNSRTQGQPRLYIPLLETYIISALQATAANPSVSASAAYINVQIAIAQAQDPMP